MVWWFLLIVISGLFWPAAILLVVFSVAYTLILIYKPEWAEWMDKHHFFG